MIGLYGCPAESNEIVRLDDPSVFTDDGETMDVSFLSAPIAAKVPWATLRRITQTVSARGPASIRVTPVVDGGELNGQAFTATLDTGATDRLVEAPLHADGSTFQLRIDVLSLEGVVAIGSTAFVMKPKRTVVGA
jgi:hypothetical protein